jgi:hypothetical protein
MVIVLRRIAAGQACGERFELNALSGYAVTAPDGYVGTADMPEVMQVVLRFSVADSPGGTPGSAVHFFSFVGALVED